VDELCQALFDSVKLQTSVKRFQASETERGCVLDFVDYPLNNRWWLEDEFTAIRKMPTEAEKIARLDALAHWEHPGPGSYYDDNWRPREVASPGSGPGTQHGSINTLAGYWLSWIRLGSGRLQPPSIILAGKHEVGADGL